MTKINYSQKLISAKHRSKRIEVFCFKGHIAVKIHRIKFTFKEKQNSHSFQGLYFSFGSPGDDDYKTGLKTDTKYYGKPVRFFLDLPENMTYEDLSKACTLNTKDYSFFRNNCADATLKLLRDTLGFTEIAHVKTRLTTTPQYIAKKALYIKKCQLKKKTDDLLSHQARLKTKLKQNPHDVKNTNLLLQNWKQLVACERAKLKIQHTELQLNAKVLSWGSLKIHRKIFNNIMLGVRLDLTISKINYLKKREDEIEKLTDLKFNKHPNPSEVQKIFDKLNLSYILRKNFKTCLDCFPFELLPGMNRKRQFLILVYQEIKNHELQQKQNRFFGKVLSKKMNALKTKLIDLNTNPLAFNNADIQKLFMETQNLLQENNNEVSSFQKGFESTFYKTWYKKSLDWKNIQLRPDPDERLQNRSRVT